MRYTNIYERTREIHMQSVLDLSNIGAGVTHQYPQITITLTPLLDGSPIANPVKVGTHLDYIRKFNMASHIKVEVEVDLPESQLEDIANTVGKVFHEIDND